MNKLFIIFALSFTIAFSYERTKIERINIIFESREKKPFDSSAVLSKLKTKEGALFSQQTFDGDLKLLSFDYHKIKPEIKEKEKRLFINIKLWPKPKIQKITWKGNYIIKTRKLEKTLNFKSGDIFDRERFQKSIKDIKDLYLKRGFFESEVTYSTYPIKNRDEITIDIRVKEGRSGYIKDIVFKGFTKAEEKELKAKMYTKKYNPLTGWLTGAGIFNRDAVEQDHMEIVNYLNNKGYADANVDVNFLEDKKTKKLIIEIVARRGILYRLGEVDFSGNSIFPDEEVKKRIVIKKDDIFSQEKLRDSAQSIKDLYGKDGYIDTEVSFNTTLFEKEPIYDVEFIINEGSQFRIGIIHVYGNLQTNTNVILRESLLTPGAVFDMRRLKATQKRLQNIGYFKNVNIYTIASKEGSNYRDINIEVEEAPTGSANISLGFSKTDSIFGSFDLVEKNFNIAGVGSLFKKGPSALRGAGEYAHAKFSIGKKERSYLVTWMDPYFRDTLWRIGVEGSKTRSKLQSKDYKITTYGASIFASYPLSNFWTFGTKYRIRHSQARLKNSAKSKKDGESDKAVKKDEEIEDNHGLISAISSSISYNTTDRPYKTRKGLRSYLEGEFSGIWGDFYFFSIKYLNALFIPVWSKGTLKFKADLKFIEPVGKTNKSKMPISELYFLGGETTVRGYKPYRLGPRRPTNIDDPVGGISSALLSCEYSQAIMDRLDVFVFFDSGSISDKHFSIPKLNSSYGAGIRLELMNRAPITIGYGIPINPDYKGDKQKFFFSMGGQF